MRFNPLTILIIHNRYFIEILFLVPKFEYNEGINSWGNTEKLARKRLLNKKSSKKYREKQKLKEVHLLESVKKLEIVSVKFLKVLELKVSAKTDARNGGCQVESCEQYTLRTDSRQILPLATIDKNHTLFIAISSALIKPFIYISVIVAFFASLS